MTDEEFRRWLNSDRFLGECAILVEVGENTERLLLSSRAHSFYDAQTDRYYDHLLTVPQVESSGENNITLGDFDFYANDRMFDSTGQPFNFQSPIYRGGKIIWSIGKAGGDGGDFRTIGVLAVDSILRVSQSIYRVRVKGYNQNCDFEKIPGTHHNIGGKFTEALEQINQISQHAHISHENLDEWQSNVNIRFAIKGEEFTDHADLSFKKLAESLANEINGNLEVRAHCNDLVITGNAQSKLTLDENCIYADTVSQVDLIYGVNEIDLTHSYRFTGQYGVLPDGKFNPGFGDSTQELINTGLVTYGQHTLLKIETPLSKILTVDIHLGDFFHDTGGYIAEYKNRLKARYSVDKGIYELDITMYGFDLKINDVVNIESPVFTGLAKIIYFMKSPLENKITLRVKEL